MQYGSIGGAVIHFKGDYMCPHLLFASLALLSCFLHSWGGLQHETDLSNLWVQPKEVLCVKLSTMYIPSTTLCSPNSSYKDNNTLCAMKAQKQNFFWQKIVWSKGAWRECLAEALIRLELFYILWCYKRTREKKRYNSQSMQEKLRKVWHAVEYKSLIIYPLLPLQQEMVLSFSFSLKM